MDDFDCLLVKTAPEITLKSSHVRKYFTDKLVKNIKGSMRAASISGSKIIKGEGRLYIFSERNTLRKIAPLLEKTFGVFAYAKAKNFSKDSLKGIVEEVTNIAAEELKK